MCKKIIQVNKINYKYPDGYRAIKDVSFYVREGEKLGIIGANGAGKSTILKLLTGILISENGNVIIDNILINKNNLREIRKTMKIEFDVPNFEKELEISIVIRKDGEVVYNRATPPEPEQQKKISEANTSKITKKNAGNLMDTNF